MSDIAIKVENLGKCYHIGQAKSGDFRQSFGHWIDKLRGRNKGHAGAGPAEEFWALKDVNFEINKGEAVGIIGRNGAGKSTLLKILSRITEPSKGRFEINGRVSSLLEVGTGFHPELSGRENIYLNGTILGMKRSEIRAKFDEIVAFSGVEKFIDTPVKHYSSGMKVRLAFSVAAHLEPEILIIDEVLAVGDAEFQKKCLGKMDEVSKSEGKTILFVSHHMGSIQKLCHKALWINEGSIVFSGTVNDSISKYISFFSAASSFIFDENQTSKPVYVKYASIVNSDFEEISELAHSETIKLFLKLRFNNSNLKSGIIAIVLLDSEKKSVFTVHKYIEDFRKDTKKDEYRLLFEIPKERIVPNNYSFTINIHSLYEEFHLLEDVCPIKIYDAGSKYLKWEGRVNYGTVFMEDATLKVVE